MAGAVTGLLQLSRQGRFFGWQVMIKRDHSRRAAVVQDVLQSKTILISSRQNPGARSGANWRGDVKLRKTAAVRRQPIDVWRLKNRMPVASDVAPTKIVGVNKKNIRPGSRS